MLTPPIPVLLPLVVAAILIALDRVLPRWLASLLAILTATGVMFAAIALAVFSRDASYIVWNLGPPPVGLAFAIDNAAAMMCVLASLLALLAFIFSYRYCGSAAGLYHGLALAMLGGMCGFCETCSLANLVIFYAIMCGAAFRLCRHDPEEECLPKGARNFGIAAGAGLCLLAVASALIWGRTGSLNMAQAGRSLAGHADPAVWAALALFTAGFFLLAGVAPFHGWVCDAFAIAPAPICALFAGALVELGIYGLVRVYWTIFSSAVDPWQSQIRLVLAAFGAVSALLGAYLCYRQRNLKRLLALANVSQMGMVLMAVALLTPDGLAGAAIYLMGHSLLKGSLFLGAGIVLHRFASLDEIHLQGRGRHLRWTGAIFFICAAGLAGLPPFGAFWGNVMMDGSAWRVGYGWMPWVAGIAAAVSGAAVFRFAGRVFFGWGPEEDHGPAASFHGRHHTPGAMYAAATVLMLLGLAAGLAPQLTGAAYGSALRVENRKAYAERVLDLQAPYPPTVHDVPAGPGDIGRALLTLAAAAGLAGYSLRRKRPYVPAHTPGAPLVG